MGVETPPLFLSLMKRTIEVDLTYQNLIDAPPPREGDLHGRASAHDKTTIDSWREIWLKHTKANKERFKEFSEHSIGKLFGINRQKPAIICGSGPSLKHSIEALKENAALEYPVLNVSCLHNFGYFEDEGFHADYYLTLDSGAIVIDDVHEGRKEKPEYYWEKTKGKKLLATVMTDPKLFDLWQGEIYLFSVIIPEFKLHQEIQAIEPFKHYTSCGGNALGGCLYIAKAIFCSDTIHFVGADFCFDFDNKFHSYATHYDQVGRYVVHTDVFGMKRKTWPSYLSFKFWMDWVSMNVPGKYINCSEGLLGAYNEGNLSSFQYMPLSEALKPYRMMEWVNQDKLDGVSGELLERKRLDLKDLFSNSKYEFDVVFF